MKAKESQEYQIEEERLMQKGESEIICHETQKQNERNEHQQKKQQYVKQQKKKKRMAKQKSKKKKQQAMETVKIFVSEFYRLKTTFAKKKSDIDSFLELQHDALHIYHFIHQALLEEVQIVSKQINELATILINSYQHEEKIEENILKKLYQKIETVIQATIQSQQFLNYFIKKYKYDRSMLNDSLDKFILKLIFEKDKSKDMLQVVLVEIIVQCSDEKLRSLVQQILEWKQIGEEYQDSDQESGLQILIEQLEDEERQKSGKRNKRQKKQQFMQDASYDSIMERLNKFELKQKRSLCNVSEEWIFKLQEKMKNFE